MAQHLGSVYDCPETQCRDYVRVGLAQDVGEPHWHQEEQENAS